MVFRFISAKFQRVHLSLIEFEFLWIFFGNLWIYWFAELSMKYAKKMIPSKIYSVMNFLFKLQFNTKINKKHVKNHFTFILNLCEPSRNFSRCLAHWQRRCVRDHSACLYTIALTFMEQFPILRVKWAHFFHIDVDLFSDWAFRRSRNCSSCNDFKIAAGLYGFRCQLVIFQHFRSWRGKGKQLRHNLR